MERVLFGGGSTRSGMKALVDPCRRAVMYRAKERTCNNHKPRTTTQQHAHLDILVEEGEALKDGILASAADDRPDSRTTVAFFAPSSVSNQQQQSIPAAVSVSLTYISKCIHSQAYSRQKENEESFFLLESQPLLQACIKRQLVGCPIVLDSRKLITTEIQIPTPIASRQWTLTVQSAAAIGVAGTDSVVCLISPSTRITLLPDDPSSSSSKKDGQHRAAMVHPSSVLANQKQDTSTTATSPVARILVETLHCIHLLHSSTMATNCSKDISRAFLLSGPPGTGKTHAVRLATQQQNQRDCHLIVLQGSELLSQGGHPAAAAARLERHFWQAAQKTQRHLLSAGADDDSLTNTVAVPVAVIFLDECDALVSSSDNSNSNEASVLEAVLGRLLDQLHSDPAWKRIVVVAATNRVDSIPSSLRRPGRFDREIPLAPPNAVTRLAILQSLLKEQYGDALESDALVRNHLAEIADACVGYVPADLAALVRRAEILRLTHHAVGADAKEDKSFDNQNPSNLMDRLQEAMNDVGASALRDAALQAPPTTTFDDVAGDPGGAKTALRQAIEWPRRHATAFAALGLTPPRGILLHGPPGCAKTTLARAAAGASGVAFLSLSPADVFESSYVGDAEAVVRRAFALARSAAPCILFFDELDAIVGCSSGDSGGDGSHGMGRGALTSAEARVLSTFLNEMDGVDGSWKDGVMVLGATNRPGTLDAALLRPGRFDKVIYVPPPDLEGRRSILSMQCRHWKTEGNSGGSSRIDIDRLASDEVTGNMTGAEIVGACREAAMRSFRDAMDRQLGTPVMKKEYLTQALAEVQPMLANPTIMAEYESFENRRRRVAR